MEIARQGPNKWRKVFQIFAETSSSLDTASLTKTGVVEQVISNNVTTETIQAAVPTQSATKNFPRVRVVK